MSKVYKLFSHRSKFLTDRRVGLMLQCCISLSDRLMQHCSMSPICRLSVALCIVAKRCVLEQKLLLTANRKSLAMKNRLVPK